MKANKVLRDEIMRDYFSELGKRGGPKGGKARWKDKSPEERSEFARKVAQARWGKRRAK